MVTIDQAKELVEWMAARGVRSFRLGELEVTFSGGGPPAEQPQLAPRPASIWEDPDLYGGAVPRLGGDL